MLTRETLSLLTLVFCLESLESIQWPAGTYGIPKPASGCPYADGFQWETGWRSQDMNNEHSNNSKSIEFHLDGEVDEKTINRSFCMKTDGTSPQSRHSWSPGEYCIYKSGKCPDGLTNGHVKWDDDDKGHNLNDEGGTLPGGVYDHNTEIRFCCRTDGNKRDPILLPSKTPFFLLAYGSAKCQMVKWAIASLEWIFFDTKDDQNTDKAVGEYPFEAGITHPTIYYCYYRGCNETLSGVSGSFRSPNYPRKYPDGQYCSWRITVSPSQQIHLTFTNFSLQSENNTDGLYVYDGENATGVVLGVFYGGRPPPEEGIYSSSNHMFVIFKSDKSVSYTGFEASYCEKSYFGQATTTATTTTQTPETTSTPAYTSKAVVSTGEPMQTTERPSEGGGKKKQREQSEGKGFNVVAVVVPVGLLAFLVAAFVAGFVYYKRRRTKKDDKGMTEEVVYETPHGETPMALDNPSYDRTNGGPPGSVENPTYDRGFYSGLTVTNRASSISENEPYSEVKELDHLDKKEDSMQRESQNPYYHTLEPSDTVVNPIYESVL